MNADLPSPYDLPRRLEALAREQHEREAAQWSPTVWPAASIAVGHPLLDLLGNGELVTIHDRLGDQLRELVDTRNPRRPPLAPAEIDSAVSAHLRGTPTSLYGNWVFYPWSRRLVHLLPEPEFRELRTSRNRNKITDEEQARLHALDLAIVGLSVGRSTAITLALESVGGRFRLADFDELALSNMNRLRAGVHELGINKAVLTARALFEIDPYLDIRIWPEGVTSDNLDAFLVSDGRVDLVFEECDDLEMKIRVREAARRHRIAVLMETSDRGMLDIERFDLDPERPFFHGLAGELDADGLRGLDTYAKVPVVAAILGLPTLSRRMAASLVDIDASLKTWPQLASGVALGGALNTEAARRIVLGELTESGRYYVDFEALVRDGTASRQPQSAAPSAPASEPVLPDPLPPLRRGTGEVTRQEIETIVAWACRAPSGGNSQPWRFEWTGDALECHVDPSRTRTVLDSGHRAAHVACGAAAEHVSLVSAALGLDADVRILPDDGEPGLAFEVHLRRATRPLAVDDLVACIPRRCTNRRRGERAPLPDGIAAALQTEAAQHGAELALVTDAHRLDAIAHVLAAADRQRLLCARMHRDMFQEIRWTREAVLETRDGLDIATLELDATERAGMTLLASWDVMRTLRSIGGGAGLERPTLQAVASASAIGLLTVDGTGTAGFLAGGRALARVWLRATALGFALQPMTALLYVLARIDAGETTDLDDASIAVFGAAGRDLNALVPSPVGHARVMLFRLAIAGDPSARSLRRDVGELLAMGENDERSGMVG